MKRLLSGKDFWPTRSYRIGPTGAAHFSTFNYRRGIFSNIPTVGTDPTGMGMTVLLQAPQSEQKPIAIQDPPVIHRHHWGMAVLEEYTLTTPDKKWDLLKERPPGRMDWAIYGGKKIPVE